MRIANLVTFIILLIGGLNWLYLAMFDNDFVSALFGSQTDVLSKIVYIAVGLSALWLIFSSIYNKGNLFGREVDL